MCTAAGLGSCGLAHVMQGCEAETTGAADLGGSLGPVLIGVIPMMFSE